MAAMKGAHRFILLLILSFAHGFRQGITPSRTATQLSVSSISRELLEQMVVKEQAAPRACDEHVWRQDKLERRLGDLWKGSHATAPLHSMEIDVGAAAAAPPVVILHGLLGSSRNFQSWAMQLAGMLEVPRRVILLDLRNHGESPHMPKMGYLDMAADVVRFLQHQKIDKASLIGHSMGGKVASAVALLFPEKVEALGVLDIAPVPYEDTGKNGVWTEVNTLLNALSEMPVSRSESSSVGEDSQDVGGDILGGKKEADAWLRDRGISDDGLRAFALTNMVADKDALGVSRLRWKIGIDVIRSSLGILGGFDIGQGLQESATAVGLTYPGDAFFVSGGRSQFIRSSHLPELSALFPNFKIAKIRDAGHWLHHEDPAGSQEMVKTFLDAQAQNNQ
uniref:AB hydrolase-1 domain-containing protein n=1 Tax=Phaeomonas parva TaxID=124430 RepID=A0A7S1Y0J3_9STRA|mmetsp:Transcript_7459/g.21725  ORF Transcript_7459/g.21725 Transcript_7459/m.21725 type:complete len:393 (+) Transcript_7459:236-1414(+)|eukprot:CAMPEP_0118876488 /NCGR_PEP_ID=MMETSP1163-20130328/17163_1 /TAXON_ID=124430 /ORGANISM="Phaeomonas parva, Strain CCMP2877" /LENGTH=392 /DNA_ID=CAMNT_0006812103 /DNA_START=194 /DNA_END=1372 /DNA_ORIENTATION=+